MDDLKYALHAFLSNLDKLAEQKNDAKAATTLLEWASTYDITNKATNVLGPLSYVSDDMNAFMAAYITHIQAISTKMMQKIMRLPAGSNEYTDPMLLKGEICWGTTQNLELLLALRVAKDDVSIPYMVEELKENRLLIIFQDVVDEHGVEGGHDHWFAIIGDHGKAHLVEYLPDMCPSVHTDSIVNIVKLVQAIRDGDAPDRFYGHVGRHIFKATSYVRRPLTAETITHVLATS